MTGDFYQKTEGNYEISLKVDILVNQKSRMKMENVESNL